MTDLDTRGRAAAAALRDSLADAPVPELEVPRHASRAPWMLAAAAVVVVTGLVAAMVLVRGDGDGDGTGLATEGPVEVPRLMLDPVPEGMEPTGRVDLPGPHEAGSVSTDAWLYGDPSDPLGAPNVAVLAVDDAKGVELPTGGTELEIAGHPAVHRQGRPDSPEEGLRILSVDLGSDGLVAVASGSADRQELERLAEQIVTSGASEPPSTLGDGLDLVADVRGADYLLIPTFLPLQSGFGVGYQGADDPSRAASVVAVRADDDDLILARWGLGPTARSVEVRDTTGWIASPFGSGHILVWEESPGVVAGLLTSLDEAGTLDAAESLRPATDAEWEALPPPDSGNGTTTFSDVGEELEVSTTGGVEDTTGEVDVATTSTTVPPDVLASLDGKEATFSWEVRAYEDGSVCQITRSDGHALEGCTGPLGGSADEVPIHVDAVQDAGTTVVFARAPFDRGRVAEAVIVGCGGAEVVMRQTPLPDGGLLAAGTCTERLGDDASVVVREPGTGDVIMSGEVQVIEPIG